MGCKIRAVSDDESGGGGGGGGGVVSNGSLREALLFTTMCIIGLPVEVHIKDGSVYSGIFHTARIENDYGVVLKKARMTKKGKTDANVANGGLIETLVVLSGDLVQVVAKGVLLPSDGLDGNVAGDNVETVACSIPCPENETKIIKSGKIDADGKNFDKIRRSAQNNNGAAHGLTRTTHDGKVPKKVENGREEEKRGPSGLEHGLSIESRKRGGIYAAKTEEHSNIPVNGRQVGENRSQGGQDIYKEKLDFHKKETIREVQSSRLSSDECITQVKPTEEIHAKVMPKPFTNGVSRDNPASSAGKLHNPCSERPISAGIPEAISSDVSTSLHAAVDVSSESAGLRSLAAPTAMFPPQSSVSNRNAKEFKLNPEAKVFSPSFLNSRSASPQPPATSTLLGMAYIPNNAPVVQVAAAQPEFGVGPFAPRPSLPAKFVPYTNLTAGNAGSGSQYAQPIVGHAGSRAQQVRFAGQYHPVQAGPTYMHPNSQAVMIGRSGQLFYVHPVSHDVVHGAAAISPVPARPLLNPHQIQFPKHQGTQAMQLCIPPPPFVAGGGQQSIVVPTQIPLLQPPFPANRPIHIPGSNGLYTTAKFP